MKKHKNNHLECFISISTFVFQVNLQ